jgi:hypothetical protein
MVSNKIIYIYYKSKTNLKNRETKFYFVAHAGLKLTVILPQPPKSRECMCVPPYLALSFLALLMSHILFQKTDKKKTLMDNNSL